MNSKFVKFIKDYLVYFLFISFIFAAYIYTFDSHIHTKYAFEDLSKIKEKKNGYYIESNNLADNSSPYDEADSDDDDTDFNSKKDLDGNYNTYNTVYEFNDVIVYRFKMVINNIFDARLFSPKFLTLYYNLPSYSSVLSGSLEKYYILERKMRI